MRTHKPIRAFTLSPEGLSLYPVCNLEVVPKLGRERWPVELRHQLPCVYTTPSAWNVLLPPASPKLRLFKARLKCLDTCPDSPAKVVSSFTPLSEGFFSSFLS